jgi:hypothetical protein
MHAFAGYGYELSSWQRDIYNSATGAWTTAQLNPARYGLAATSVGSVALFAGGSGGSALWLRDETMEGGLLVFVSDVFVCLFGMRGAMA